MAIYTKSGRPVTIVGYYQDPSGEGRLITCRVLTCDECGRIDSYKTFLRPDQLIATGGREEINRALNKFKGRNL
jgi:hypothetical protein